MGFGIPFRDFKLNFDFGSVRIKAIDANHSVFMKSFPRHMHSFYELHYIAGGQGKLILDDSEHELSEGDLFLLGPKAHHAQITNPSNLMEEYHFAFEVQYRNAKEDEISRFFKGSDFYICKDTRNIKTLFSELELEINNRETGYVMAIQSILERILLLTVRDFSNVAEDIVTKTVPDDRRSLLMDEAFLYSYQTLTLEGLAQVLNLSPRHTERLIYEKYGTSFVKMRMQSRLNAALNMLSDTELNLSEIAEKCGFSSYIHFSKAFKSEFGVPPSQYKKSLKGVK